MITDINQLDFSQTYTYADYLTWQFKERLELIKGRLFRMSPAPKRIHQEISIALASEIKTFLKKKSCKVYSAPFDVRFPGRTTNDNNEETFTVVQPDICIICDTSKLDDRGCFGAPDLIVEILSPASSEKDVKDKYELYQENKVKEYWIVFPDFHILEVFKLNEKGIYYLDNRYTKSDQVTTTVLPGLLIDLNEVFSEV